MRTAINVNMKPPFDYKKIHTYYATLTYVSANCGIYLVSRQRHIQQRRHV